MPRVFLVAFQAVSEAMDNDESGFIGLAPSEPGAKFETIGDELDGLVSAGWACRDAAGVRAGHDVSEGEGHTDE
jgi:hypothetical protein